jgi:hypothetical protein
MMKRLFQGLLALCLTVLPLQAQELSLSIETDHSDGLPKEVVVKGEVGSRCWLGVSFYPYGTENLLSDGRHQIFELPAGEFTHTFKVGSGLIDGGVECAIWSTYIKASDCASKCEWCEANGYHLEDRRIYLYGSLARAAVDAKDGK